MSDPTLPLIDGSYGKPRTYDLPGQCLTCGQRFNVRRCKGDKPPLSVDCPNCECTEYSWRDLNAILAQPAAPAEGLDLPDGWALTITYHPFPENRWIASAWNFRGGVSKGNVNGFGRTEDEARVALRAALEAKR